jgi:hypothetical protein
MSIIFQSTEKFEKDIKSFQAKERERIISNINLYCSTVETDPALFRQHSFRPLQLILRDDLASSLYVLRIDQDIRVILTLEDDPLFDRTVVTLLSVVRHHAVETVYREVAESLYQGCVAFVQGDQIGGNQKAS